ncbi:MAG: hypothetical protein ACO1RX_02605 [Candidatus Sericytochromatia bacterium]
MLLLHRPPLVHLFLLLMLMILPAYATEETPTIGFSGTQAPVQGRPLQILISHASYPQLQAVSVTVSCQEGLEAPQSETLPAPSDSGIVTWIPAHTGNCLITATGLALPDAPALAITRRVTVRAERPQGWPGWIWALLAALLVMLGGLLWAVRALRPRS